MTEKIARKTADFRRIQLKTGNRIAGMYMRGIKRFCGQLRPSRNPWESTRNDGLLDGGVIFEHCARGYIPEQKHDGRAMREQGRRQRHIEEDLRKDGGGEQDKAWWQTRRQAVAECEYEPAHEH